MARLTRSEVRKDSFMVQSEDAIYLKIKAQFSMLTSKLPKGSAKSLEDWWLFCKTNNLLKNISQEEYDFGFKTTLYKGPVYDSIFRYFSYMRNHNCAINKDGEWTLI